MKKNNNKYLAAARGTKQHRKEFIETSSYINGVREATTGNKRRGRQVIRALNKEEKEWLANFNATYEHGVRSIGNEEFAVTEEEWSEIDHQDYARKMDLMYIARKDGKLIAYDIHESDKFVSEAEKDVEPENLLLENFNPVKEKK